MKRRDDLTCLASLARLQQLATRRRLEILAQACERMSEQTREFDDAGREAEAARQRVDGVLSGASLCVDRLVLAASELDSCDARCTEAFAALANARNEEETARIDCVESRKRHEWIRFRVRALRMRKLLRQEEGVLRESLAFRVVRSEGS